MAEEFPAGFQFTEQVQWFTFEMALVVSNEIVHCVQDADAVLPENTFRANFPADRLEPDGGC